MAGSATSWFSDIGAFAGIIGATAWLAPLVYDKFTKPSIEGRLITKKILQYQGNPNISKV